MHSSRVRVSCSCSYRSRHEYAPHAIGRPIVYSEQQPSRNAGHGCGDTKRSPSGSSVRPSDSTYARSSAWIVMAANTVPSQHSPHSRHSDWSSVAMTTSSPAAAPRPKRFYDHAMRRGVVAAVGVLVLAIVVGAGVVLFRNDDEPSAT